MILDCILTSLNENKLYLDFVSIFIKKWNKLYPYPLVDVKIILISKKYRLICVSIKYYFI